MRPLTKRDFQITGRGRVVLNSYRSDLYSCPICGKDAVSCKHTEREMYDAIKPPVPEAPTFDESSALAGLTADRAARKAAPMHRGLKRYFPNALAYVSHVSYVGNEQHNPGEPMHWAYDKSTDEGDCIERHQAEAGTFDSDGLRHSGKVAWRALAQLERELLEADPALKPGLGVRNFSRGSK